jgi:hypothetical protein
MHWILHHIPQLMVGAMIGCQAVDEIRNHGTVNRTPRNAYAAVGATAIMAVLLGLGGFWTA